MATTRRINITATVRELRKKAVWLTLDNGISLWFQLRSANNNGDGTWSVTETAYNNAMVEHNEYVEYQKATITILAGTWGHCKNGSYWLRTHGENVDIEKPVKTDLAFVTKAIENEDGTLTVNKPEAMKALDLAAYRTNKGNLAINFVGYEY